MEKLIRTNALAALLAVAGFSAPLMAGSEDVVIEGAWSRAAIGVNRPGAAYMTVRNTGDAPVTLTGLETPLAVMPEIHETSTNAEGVSSMAPAGKITIAPGDSIELAPGGLHAMLMQLQEPMTEGETFVLTLEFSDGGEVTAEVPILGIASRGPEG
ncbi:copper chaperone PCu(A)C [Roseovarius spongiae]|uniref:Copper chaperone PCu(A)C n=1 Tax=Roseovarius spongiae TaxID=2320272 RepID=A0A3A8AQ59_9RHOB|nr:copper chaperone PCu(A)C [Roseovarius spongiae]RKF12497.1 copper chaperone PCu(A)C [Roseovarius spongiae]